MVVEDLFLTFPNTSIFSEEGINLYTVSTWTEKRKPILKTIATVSDPKSLQASDSCVETWDFWWRKIFFDQ